MPGIFGFVSERPIADAASLARRMGSLLSSGEGQRASAVCGERWALGATWIPGQQREPGPAATRGRWSVAVGEVYPSGDVPTTAPVSPRLALLEAVEFGVAGRLAAVNGQFAGAVVDEASGTVTLLCDRYGLHPIYWTCREGLFAFASEAKALLALRGLGQEVDPEGLAAFLLLGEHFSDTTLLEGVKVAPAACLVRSRGGRPLVESWWRIRYTASMRAGDEEEVAREAGRRFVRAVERQTAGEERIAVPLSGGLDSRICAAAVPPARRGATTAFTWGDRGCFDRSFGQAVAARCGIRHVDLDYRYEALVASAALGVWRTDGLAGIADFHVLPYVEDLSRASSVVLNGFAGDALLGGNFHWRSVRGLPLEALARATFHKRNDALPPGEIDAILHPQAREAAGRLAGTFTEAFCSHEQADALGTLDAFLLDSRVRRWTSFGTQLLRSRLISRAPFFDNDFFDLVATVPPDRRTDHRFYRKVLLATFPEVARVGWQTTGFPSSWPPGVFRPLGVVVRRGRGIVERLSAGALRSPYQVARPGKAWRGPLARRLQAELFEGPGPHWEVFDRRAGERIWRELQAGADGRAKLVGVLLAIRYFLEQGRGDRPEPPLRPDRVELLDAGRLERRSA